MVKEILVNNSAIWNLIRENQLHQIPSTMQMWVREWMQLLEKDIIELVNANIILYWMIKYANNPKTCKRKSWFIEKFFIKKLTKHTKILYNVTCKYILVEYIYLLFIFLSTFYVKTNKKSVYTCGIDNCNYFSISNTSASGQTFLYSVSMESMLSTLLQSEPCRINSSVSVSWACWTR